MVSKTEQQRMNSRFACLVKEAIDEITGNPKVSNSLPSLWENVDFVALNRHTSLDDYIESKCEEVLALLKSDDVSLHYFDITSCEQDAIINSMEFNLYDPPEMP